MLTWYTLLHVHLTGEEATFFPEIEKFTGEKGIMDANVQQHHAFEKGLEAFHTYVDECLAGKKKYDGSRIISIIDSFGKDLIQHLTDEIPTLLDLKRHADKLQDLPHMMQAEAETNMVCISFHTHL